MMQPNALLLEKFIIKGSLIDYHDSKCHDFIYSLKKSFHNDLTAMP